ncbi:MAG: periplasmic heavy metal sensor [Candidatus Solibacter usitatus]|nr:periplasmic heavy metal sensor [Candidatus Solibacter usitatus]
MRLPLVILTGFAASLLAQGPGVRQGPFQPATDQVKAYLNLTDAQIQSLQSIRRQEAQELQSIRQDMVTAQQALADLLQKGATDANAVGKLVLDAANLRKQIDQKRSSFQDQALNVLDATQKTKLKGLEEAQKLEPAMRGAQVLGLLAAPQMPPDSGPAGLRPGMFGFPGPGGMGGPGGMVRPLNRGRR